MSKNTHTLHRRFGVSSKGSLSKTVLKRSKYETLNSNNQVEDEKSLGYKKKEYPRNTFLQSTQRGNKKSGRKVIFTSSIVTRQSKKPPDKPVLKKTKEQGSHKQSNIIKWNLIGSKKTNTGSLNIAKNIKSRIIGVTKKKYESKKKKPTSGLKESDSSRMLTRARDRANKLRDHLIVEPTDNVSKQRSPTSTIEKLPKNIDSTLSSGVSVDDRKKVLKINDSQRLLVNHRKKTRKNDFVSGKSIKEHTSTLRRSARLQEIGISDSYKSLKVVSTLIHSESPTCSDEIYITNELSFDTVKTMVVSSKNEKNIYKPNVKKKINRSLNTLRKTRCANSKSTPRNISDENVGVVTRSKVKSVEINKETLFAEKIEHDVLEKSRKRKGSLLRLVSSGSEDSLVSETNVSVSINSCNGEKSDFNEIHCEDQWLDVTDVVKKDFRAKTLKSGIKGSKKLSNPQINSLTENIKGQKLNVNSNINSVTNRKGRRGVNMQAIIPRRSLRLKKTNISCEGSPGNNDFDKNIELSIIPLVNSDKENIPGDTDFAVKFDLNKQQDDNDVTLTENFQPELTTGCIKNLIRRSAKFLSIEPTDKNISMSTSVGITQDSAVLSGSTHIIANKKYGKMNRLNQPRVALRTSPRFQKQASEDQIMNSDYVSHEESIQTWKRGNIKLIHTNSLVENDKSLKTSSKNSSTITVECLDGGNNQEEKSPETLPTFERSEEPFNTVPQVICDDQNCLQESNDFLQVPVTNHDVLQQKDMGLDQTGDCDINKRYKFDPFRYKRHLNALQSCHLPRDVDVNSLNVNTSGNEDISNGFYANNYVLSSNNVIVTTPVKDDTPKHREAYSQQSGSIQSDHSQHKFRDTLSLNSHSIPKYIYGVENSRNYENQCYPQRPTNAVFEHLNYGISPQKGCATDLRYNKKNGYSVNNCVTTRQQGGFTYSQQGIPWEVLTSFPYLMNAQQSNYFKMIQNSRFRPNLHYPRHPYQRINSQNYYVPPVNQDLSVINQSNVVDQCISTIANNCADQFGRTVTSGCADQYVKTVTNGCTDQYMRSYANGCTDQYRRSITNGYTEQDSRSVANGYPLQNANFFGSENTDFSNVVKAMGSLPKETNAISEFSSTPKLTFEANPSDYLQPVTKKTVKKKVKSSWNRRSKKTKIASNDSNENIDNCQILIDFIKKSAPDLELLISSLVRCRYGGFSIPPEMLRTIEEYICKANVFYKYDVTKTCEPGMFDDFILQPEKTVQDYQKLFKDFACSHTSSNIVSKKIDDNNQVSTCVAGENKRSKDVSQSQLPLPYINTFVNATDVHTTMPGGCNNDKNLESNFGDSYSGGSNKDQLKVILSSDNVINGELNYDESPAAVSVIKTQKVSQETNKFKNIDSARLYMENNSFIEEELFKGGNYTLNSGKNNNSVILQQYFNNMEKEAVNFFKPTNVGSNRYIETLLSDKIDEVINNESTISFVNEIVKQNMLSLEVAMRLIVGICANFYDRFTILANPHGKFENITREVNERVSSRIRLVENISDHIVNKFMNFSRACFDEILSANILVEMPEADISDFANCFRGKSEDVNVENINKDYSRFLGLPRSNSNLENTTEENFETNNFTENRSGTKRGGAAYKNSKVSCRSRLYNKKTEGTSLKSGEDGKSGILNKKRGGKTFRQGGKNQ